VKKFDIEVTQRDGTVRKYKAQECITVCLDEIITTSGRTINQNNRHVGAFFGVRDIKEFFSMNGSDVKIEEVK
jgi:hypothetical protein